VEVVPAVSPSDLKRFIRFPYDKYRRDPHWVAPLPSDEQTRLTPGKNPYFDHAEAAHFLALHGGRVVGRVSASVDRNYDEFQGEKQGAFGFFEADSAEAAAALLEAAERWVRARGAEIFRGPLSFTTNDECGVLVEGHGRRPVLMMPYNPPEYAAWIEAAGLRKAKDLYSFEMPVPDSFPPAFERLAAAARRQPGLVVRPLDMKQFREELDRVKVLYNAAWEKNWGFVPMTDREIDHMAAQLKPALVPDIVQFAEIDGRPVGFILNIPDVNIALKPIRGSLFPFGLARLLWALPRIREFRVMALGLEPDQRRRGLALLLIVEATKALRRRGFKHATIGWTLEDNGAVNHIIATFGGARYAVHRVYERPLR
jgi:GNAT superfamily N-acetyltransferase